MNTITTLEHRMATSADEFDLSVSAVVFGNNAREVHLRLARYDASTIGAASLQRLSTGAAARLGITLERLTCQASIEELCAVRTAKGPARSEINDVEADQWTRVDIRIGESGQPVVVVTWRGARGRSSSWAIPITCTAVLRDVLDDMAIAAASAPPAHQLALQGHVFRPTAFDPSRRTTTQAQRVA
jgi:hypothetical protein